MSTPLTAGVRRENTTEESSGEKGRMEGYPNCPHCSLEYVDVGMWRQHIANCCFRRQEKENQCPHCEYKATRKYNLERHIKQKHWQILGLPSPAEQHTCNLCGKKFSRDDKLQFHKRKYHPENTYQCQHCKKEFTHKENWRQHNCKLEKKWKCQQCGVSFTQEKNLKTHMKEHEQRGGGATFSSIPEVPQQHTVEPDEVTSSASGLRKEATFQPQTRSQQNDLKIFFQETTQRLQSWLEQSIVRNKALKWNVILHTDMVMKVGGVVKEVTPIFKTKKEKPFVTTASSNIRKQIGTAFERLEDLVDNYVERGSGWQLRYIEKLVVETSVYTPLRGSTYLPLHPFLKHKKAIVNVKNEDNTCFKWAILSALHPAEADAERISKYRRYENELDFTGLTFPVDISEIDRFEAQNPNISVTVIGYEQSQKLNKEKEPVLLFPLRIASEKKEYHIILLHWEKEEMSHYAWVKSMSRLLSHLTHHHGRKHICERCFSHFGRKDLLEKHEEACKTHEFQKVEVTEEPITFKNERNSEPAPFVVYADFECLLKTISRKTMSEKTEKVQKHIPCSYAWALVSSHPDVKNKVWKYCPLDDEEEMRDFVVSDDETDEDQEAERYTEGVDNDDDEAVEEADEEDMGEDMEEEDMVEQVKGGKRKRSEGHEKMRKKMKRHKECPPIEEYNADEEMGSTVVEHFLEELQELEEELLPYLKENKSMTELDEEDFQSATNCCICHKPFTENEKKVRDHDHATGEYRGAAHSTCNLQKRRQIVIPIVIHNLRGYDAHLIMRSIHKFAADKKFSVIPNNKEKYISFTLGHLRFIDSVQFLNESLDSLAKNLTEFPILEELSPYNEEATNMLKKKGVYPYEYMDSLSKFKEVALPPKEKFFSHLNNQGISDEDYSHAQNVWHATNCQSLKDYHDVYLDTDVLLLADVFEHFRKTCMEVYSLDPAHYYTAPGLAWDAALKVTGITLDPVLDVDMHLFLEAGMRGGVSTITHRHAEANNPHLEDYDVSKPSSYLMYLDANNLYGWAMSQPLPTTNFKWVEGRELTELEENLHEIPEDAPTGYILEVDMEYPKELHDEHNDYPLAPENILITPEMRSPYTKEIGEKIQYKPAKVKKLVPNLHSKEKYVVHYRNLKYYIEKGMKLAKIHRAIKFQQKDWLKQYINLNTDRRSRATNNFEKNFYKLMNNSVFGKTMENIRNRRNIQMAFTPKKFKKLVNRPTYIESTTFIRDEEDESCFIVVELQKTNLKLEKPIYTGFTVLDLSKLWMYKFHYDVMLARYSPDQLKLLFTDTDSLTYHIKTEDVYKDMEEDLELYDTSDYPKDSPLFSTVNKKVIGKFKDENAGVPLKEFVGLRSKMYAMADENKEKKTAKGIKKNVTKKELSLEDYKKCLFNQNPITHSMMGINSHQHVLYTEKLEKTSLSPYDDKRYILEDGVTTRAYGHFKNLL